MKMRHLLQQHWPWMISGILCLAIGFVLGSHYAAPIGDSEARGELRQLEITRANDQKRIAVFEVENKSLLEKNRRLEVQLAAVDGVGGFGLEKQQEIIDDRKAELDRLRNQLIARDEIIVQRELRVATMEKEFYEKTNMTMTDIGEARHIKEEYENMRIEKNAAIQMIERWLRNLRDILILLLISLVGVFFYLIRSFSTHTAQRRDIQDIQRVIHVVDRRLEGIEDQR